MNDSEQPIGQQMIDSGREATQSLYGFDRAAAEHPRDQLLHELFESAVCRTPNAIALVTEISSLTYTALNSKANRLARYLRSKGAGADCLVAVYMMRSADLVIALLGILKSGGAYLPLDPMYPSERLAFMLRDAAPSLLLTEHELTSMVPACTAEVISVDRLGEELLAEKDTNLERDRSGLTSRNLAYVIYTSGSTGEPKGVAAEHFGMVNRIAAQAAIDPFSSDDVCLQKTSIGFVDSIFEFFGPLSSGLPLVLAPPAATRDLQQLASTIEMAGVTRVVTVPSLADAFVRSTSAVRSLAGLRSWTLSGESLPVDLLRELHRRFPTCIFVNIYGSSEVAADVCFHVTTHQESATVPIGRAIQNTQIYILDSELRPVIGDGLGEIYVGGAGVARGYVDRPALTAKRFVACPFDGGAGGRMYKTGDLGHWRSDGNIEYRGRRDGQVKIRGFRVVLSEIEIQLTRHANVKEAIVIAREDASVGKQLIAYVVPQVGGSASVEELRAHAESAMPEYMVPSAFVVLPSMPLSPNGKVDRLALPVPDVTAQVSSEYEAPTGEMEKLLAEIWQELLHVRRVGRRDDFFRLGGHSLLALQMLDRLSHVGMSGTIRSLYQNPILGTFATSLARHRNMDPEFTLSATHRGLEEFTPEMQSLIELDARQLETITQQVPGGAANVQDIYPLTPAQEGLLFHHLLDEQRGDTYVATTLLSVDSRDGVDSLLLALQYVVDRHDALRTAIVWEGLLQPVQVVHRRATLPIEDVILEGDRPSKEVIKVWMKPESQQINLRQAPLMRVRLVRDTQDGQWYVLLQIHHLVDDDISLRILISEVAEHLRGGIAELPRPVPFRRYVERVLAYAKANDAAAFFRDRLSDVESSTAPFGLLAVHGEEAGTEEACVAVDEPLSRRVRFQARNLAVSVAALFHAAWSLVLARTSGSEDVVFGTVLLGRFQAGAIASRMIGMFVNTLPIRIPLRGVTAQALVLQAHRVLIEVMDHEQASLAMAQRCSGVGGQSPLFSTVLNYRPYAADRDSDWNRMNGIRLLARRERTNYPITLSVDELQAGFVLTAITDRRVESRRIAGYLLEAVQVLVDALDHSPRTLASTLSVVPSAERRLVEEFGTAPSRYPCGRLLNELFEEQAQRTPDAVAIVYEHEVVTYSHLRDRANHLARCLREEGMSFGEFIPILMPRGVRMVIAQLAILMIGGAYVPIDPQWPTERKRLLMRDCGARLVISDQPSAAGLEVERLRWLDCTKVSEDSVGRSRMDVVRAPPNPPAYVMYTSGSTGVPKGVIVSHDAIGRLAIENGYAHIGPMDCIAYCSNPSFDASTFEVWGALLNGARLVIVPPSVVLDARAFGEALTRERVTILWLTIGLFTQYADTLGRVFRHLRYLITGGDVVEPAVVRKVLLNTPPQYLLNAYGPTECTTFTTMYQIENTDEDAKCLPIGRPISNTSVYILDNSLQPAPIGVAGEIHIGGTGVGVGYLNRPSLTAQRFIADPFASAGGARMYKTGDLGRWNASGYVVFVGRTDQQVKLRGFRIELGEIEARLAQHPRVTGTAVVTCKSGSGEKALAAYVTITPGASIAAEDLRDHLRTALPEYMVPGAIVILDQFPLTATGKVDRRALPAPMLRVVRDVQFEAPQGEVEAAIASIWQEVLCLDRIGRDDNFFERGGHSLLAMQVVLRLRALLAVDVPISVLLRGPTVRELAVHVSEAHHKVLLDDIEHRRNGVEELLDRIASMPESSVREWVRKLKMEERP